MQTIHENKVLINPPQEQTTSEKYKIPELLEKMKAVVLSLQRYDAGHNDSIREDEEGEYILLKDVLALFSAKKE